MAIRKLSQVYLAALYHKNQTLDFHKNQSLL
jgi:hypothetical protein